MLTNTCWNGGEWLDGCEVMRRLIRRSRSCTCTQIATFEGQSWRESFYLWDGKLHSFWLGAHGKVVWACWDLCFWLHLVIFASLHRCEWVSDFDKLVENISPTCVRYTRNHPIWLQKTIHVYIDTTEGSDCALGNAFPWTLDSSWWNVAGRNPVRKSCLSCAWRASSRPFLR